LERLHATNDGVAFWSRSRKFKLMIRPDPEGSAGKFVTFDVVMLNDDHTLDKFLELDTNGGFVDDDNEEYVIDSWEFDKKKPGSQDLDSMIECVNSVYNYELCHCGERFIKDVGASMCVFCEMYARDEDLVKFTCPICLDDGIALHSKKTTCCSNVMHKTCYDEWSRKGNSKCAICRASDRCATMLVTTCSFSSSSDDDDSSDDDYVPS
jgi:hypothetical protein